MYLLVMYDISDDKRRRQVEKLLSTYGKRVNYSVFEVEINSVDYGVLLQKLKKESSAKLDHIRIYFLDKIALARSFVLHTNAEVFNHEPLYI